MSLVRKLPENIKRKGFMDSMKWMPELDGIRGALCILVILYHIRHSFEYKSVQLYEYIFRSLDTLWWVVDVFFALSGFLITFILFDLKTKGKGLRSFYIRRAIRTFPLYYLTLAFFIFILPNFSFFYNWDALMWVKESQAWFWVYLQNFKFILNGHDQVMTMFAHFWTLAIEEQFYLFWPIIFFITPLKRIRLVTLVIIFIAFAFRIYVVADGDLLKTMNTYTFSKLDAIMVGALFALEVKTGEYFIDKKVTLLTVILFIVLQSIYFTVGGPFWFGVSASSGLILICYGIYLFLRFLFNYESGVNSFLRLRPIVSLGHYGYGVYVLHMPLIKVFDRMDVFESMEGVIKVPGLVFTCYFLLVLFTSYLLGVLSWKIIESNFLKLKRYFPY